MDVTDDGRDESDEPCQDRNGEGRERERIAEDVARAEFRHFRCISRTLGLLSDENARYKVTVDGDRRRECDLDEGLDAAQRASAQAESMCDVSGI